MVPANAGDNQPVAPGFGRDGFGAPATQIGQALALQTRSFAPKFPPCWLCRHLRRRGRPLRAKLGKTWLQNGNCWTPRVFYGNVPNRGLIDNLPHGCCVEVPCLAAERKHGIQPTQIGPLPPHLAALMQTNINVQALTVEAALTGRREHIYHATMLDPHTAAELDLDQIWALVDELIQAHGDWLPEYD